MANKSTVPSISYDQENGYDEQDILYALSHRKTLHQAEITNLVVVYLLLFVRAGIPKPDSTFDEVDQEWTKLKEWCPQIVEDDKSAVCFLLHFQKFVELVQDCVALLAYEQPREFFVWYLLDESQCEVVADLVNAMIPSTNPNLKDVRVYFRSYLERLLRQLTACHIDRRTLNRDQGEALHLPECLAAA